ncbi:hypothetical protein OOJ91_13720 [Micromonospora lupini]|uniref:hypothetical protein n=1 Tax=Micromonospora lupini TaxID=285679 RepID=UPI0022526EAF|nr:hypothetical protein [Micromonospora lupini]MCX5066905.1 hypothetical protein [Micromonospora lupini]
MTSQQESRWSLNHTGNRVVLAVLVGVIVGLLGTAAGITGVGHFVVFLVAAVVTYGVATAMAVRRR